MLARFLAKVCQRGSDACWLWLAGKYPNGYGAFRVGKRILGAHVVAYMLFIGPVPKGMEVMHTCDVPACVNPAHLKLGTHADNMRDKDIKGRGNYAAGERHGWAKLTEAAVVAIRNDARPQKEIAREYGVAPNTISGVKAGKTWKGGPPFSTSL